MWPVSHGLLWMDALTGWQCTLFWKGIRNNRNVHVMCCFKGVIFSCCSYKVVEFKEIVQKEDCFQDKEFELIKQCCEWQMMRRLNLSEVRERLEEMNHLYTGTIRALFCFYIIYMYIYLYLYLLFFFSSVYLFVFVSVLLSMLLDWLKPPRNKGISRYLGFLGPSCQ